MNHKEFNVPRVKRIAVSGAFHTHLMKSNIEDVNPLKVLLAKSEIVNPTIPTYSNVTGHVYKNKYEIMELLSRQFYEPVKWESILHNLYSTIKFEVKEEVVQTYESGPSKQLGFFLRSVNNKAFRYYKPLDV